MKLEVNKILLLSEPPSAFSGSWNQTCRDLPYKIYSTSSPEERKSILSQKEIQILLLPLSRDQNSLEPLHFWRNFCPELPLVVFVFQNEEALAWKALEEGAEDYLIWEDLNSSQLEKTIHSVYYRHGRQKAEKEEKKSFLNELELYRQIFIHSTDGIGVINPESGCYIAQNKAHEELIGYSDRELEGATPIIHLGEETFHEIRQKIEKEGHFRGEVESFPKEGESLYLDISAFEVLNYQGEPTAYVAIKKDITSRREAEEALREREELFRQLTETIQEVFWLNDPEKKETLYISPGYEKIWGKSRQSLRKSPWDWLESIHPEDRDRVEREARVLQKKGQYDTEYRIIRPDGEIRWIRDRAFPIVSEEGEVIRICGIAEDITDLKMVQEELENLNLSLQRHSRELEMSNHKLEEEIVERQEVARALVESRANFSNIVERNIDAIFVLNQNREIEYLNQAAEVFLDREKKELLGRPFPLDFPSKEKQKEVEIVTEKGECGQAEMRIMDTRWKEKEAHLVILRDITREKSMQREIETQQKLAAVGQLAAGIAHDFNNLLQGILGYISVFRKDDRISEEMGKDLDFLHGQGQRATALVGQILDIGRRTLTRKEVFDLQPLIESVMRLLKRIFPAYINLSFKVDSGEYYIVGDETKIQQIITNLAVNSRDAMPDGGRFCLELRKIEIPPFEKDYPSGIGQGEWIKVVASDTGTGISPEHMPHIFEPYFTSKARSKGTGLGLAQVYGLVKQHDGFIEVESREGGGTVFSIYFPGVAKKSEVEKKKVKSEEEPRGKGKKLLLVEDDLIVLNALTRILELWNFEILTARNGREAEEVFCDHQEEISLVISDMVMPEMGGVELARKLYEKCPSVKVLILSGYPLDSEEGVKESQGVVGWLQKPVNIEEFSQRIREQIEES